MSSDGEREDSGRRQTRNEDRQGVRDPRDEGVPAAEPYELAIGGAHTRESVVLASVRDKLRRSAQELDEVGRQLTSGGCLTADAPREAGSEERYGDAGEREADREDDRRGRQHECRRDDARHRDDESDERRGDAAQVDPLERVDITDHPADEVAAAKCVELGRRQRLDALVDGGADPPERAQREVVRGEPLEVAGERAREREETDDDDDGRQ